MVYEKIIVKILCIKMLQCIVINNLSFIYKVFNASSNEKNVIIGNIKMISNLFGVFFQLEIFFVLTYVTINWSICNFLKPKMIYYKYLYLYKRNNKINSLVTILVSVKKDFIYK